jgi:hypothetical protein
MARALTWACVAAFPAGAVYELALALGALDVGREPGDDPAGQSAVAILITLAFFVALVVAALGRTRAVGLLAPAAALFVTASFYTFDPYFAPEKRRYSDGGAVGATAIYVVLVCAFVVGLFSWRRPRLGGPVTTLMLAAIAFVGLIAGDGH